MIIKDIGSNMFVIGYALIVILTCYLIAMNVRSAVAQFSKDRNEIRLYSFLVTLLIAGSIIIGVSGAIVQRVIDSHAAIAADFAQTPVPRYK